MTPGKCSLGPTTEKPCADDRYEAQAVVWQLLGSTATSIWNAGLVPWSILYALMIEVGQGKCAPKWVFSTGVTVKDLPRGDL